MFLLMLAWISCWTASSVATNLGHQDPFLMPQSCVTGVTLWALVAHYKAQNGFRLFCGKRECKGAAPGHHKHKNSFRKWLYNIKCRAITRNKVDLLLMISVELHFSVIVCEMYFSFKAICLKILSVKYSPLSSGLNMLAGTDLGLTLLC